MEEENVKNKFGYNGTIYKFEVDKVPTKGSDNPISSNAVYEILTQLLQYLDRPIVEDINSLDNDDLPKASTALITVGGIKDYINKMLNN